MDLWVSDMSAQKQAEKRLEKEKREEETSSSEETKP